MFHCNRTHSTLLVPVSVWFQFSRNILILLPISTCYNQHVLKIKMLHPPKQIRFHPCITPLPRHKGHLSKIATLLCWGRSRGVRDITTCSLGLRMPQIPFPRTSILKMFRGGGYSWPNLQEDCLWWPVQLYFKPSSLKFYMGPSSVLHAKLIIRCMYLKVP